MASQNKAEQRSINKLGVLLCWCVTSKGYKGYYFQVIEIHSFTPIAICYFRNMEMRVISQNYSMPVFLVLFVLVGVKCKELVVDLTV